MRYFGRCPVAIAITRNAGVVSARGHSMAQRKIESQTDKPYGAKTSSMTDRPIVDACQWCRNPFQTIARTTRPSRPAFGDRVFRPNTLGPEFASQDPEPLVNPARIPHQTWVQVRHTWVQARHFQTQTLHTYMNMSPGFETAGVLLGATRVTRLRTEPSYQNSGDPLWSSEPC